MFMATIMFWKPLRKPLHLFLLTALFLIELTSILITSRFLFPARSKKWLEAIKAAAVLCLP